MPRSFAAWFIQSPHLWRRYAMRAAMFQPVKTLIRGAPWEDTQ